MTRTILRREKGRQISWLAGLVLVGAVGGMQAEDWPNYRGANYDGVSVEKGWSVAGEGGDGFLLVFRGGRAGVYDGEFREVDQSGFGVLL
jgi:hypothetical protein